MRHASEATRAFYEHGADLLLLAASRNAAVDINQVSPEGRLALLERHLLNDKSTLARGTVCVYRQHVSAAITTCVSAGADPSLADEAKETLLKALTGRIGEPSPERGATLKIEVPEKFELADTFDLLRDRFCSMGEILDLVLCLYLLVVPRIGLRPIEVTWARREGNELVVATAKRSGRPERRVPLHGWPDDYLFALDIFLSLVPRELDAQGFKLWRNALASRLARASKHSRKRRRLALYCCRHIAIASWRDIGMSPEEIQRLVGHVRVSSQSGYARGKAGYGEKWMFSDASARTDTPQGLPLAPVELAAAHHEATGISSEETQAARQLASDSAGRDVADGGSGNRPGGQQGTKTVAEFDYEVFPTPNSSPQGTNYNLEAKQHFKQLEENVAVVVQGYTRRRRVKPEDDAGPMKPGKRRE